MDVRTADQLWNATCGYLQQVHVLQLQVGCRSRSNHPSSQHGDLAGLVMEQHAAIADHTAKDSLTQ